MVTQNLNKTSAALELFERFRIIDVSLMLLISILIVFWKYIYDAC